MSGEMEIGRQWVVRVRNDLLLLLEQILPLCPGAEDLREDLAILTPYAVEVRYPDEGFMPSSEDAEEARSSAQRVLDWIAGAQPELTV